MADVRLIDANALTRWLESVLSNANPLDRRARAAFSEVLARVKTMLDIDAVPVVHARWVPNHGSYGTPHCSNCKWRIPYSEDSTLDARSFCPNCGAIMDGGAEQ